MALYQVQYQLPHEVSTIYARSPEDIVDIMKQFQRPDYDLPKPISTPAYPNEPSAIEKVDHANLLFDYRGICNSHQPLLECRLTPDFTVKIRKGSLDIFVASQPYFNEAKVENLFLVHYKYGPTAFVFLPEDIAKKLSTLNVSCEFMKQQKESQRLAAKLGQRHVFPLKLENGVGGYRN